MPNERFNIFEIKIRILDLISKSKREEKFNLLGRGNSQGNLERAMGLEFSSEEKQIAQQGFNELAAGGYLQNDTAQCINPEGWFLLSRKGVQALASGCLDKLDEALDGVDVNLKTLRYGALSALKDYGPDSMRQAAHSARELIRQTLVKAAPHEKIAAQVWYKDPKTSESKITRKQQARFILEQKGNFSKRDVKLTDNLCETVQILYDNVTKESHRDVNQLHSDVEDLIKTTELTLRKLLL